MKKILVFGYFGFNNFGDELLLKSFLEIMKRFCYENKIYVLYNLKNKVKFEDFYKDKFGNNLVLINRWNFFKIFETILNVDTIFCIGGLFQDKTSSLSLYYYLTIIKIAKFFNKKVLILGTEFDVKNKNKKILKKVLEKVDYVGVRNLEEVNKVSLLSKNIKVNFFPDISFVLYEKGFEKIDTTKKDVLGIIVKSPNKKFYNKELQQITNFCNVISKKYKICLIPFHLGKDLNSEDYLFALKILDKIDSGCVKVWDKIEDVKKIFAEIENFVVSRFHGIIVCLMLNKKFVCISKDLKLINFIKDIKKISPSVQVYDSYEKIDTLFFDKIEKTLVSGFEDLCVKNKNMVEKIFLDFKNYGWI
jgi:polysaccharide pyruvyl transferase WcaK-like protein